MSEKPDIKIFVVCHKPSYVPENPYLYPIQVGAALAGSEIPGMLHDNTGDNISIKNKSYCELTAQYWAWKNSDADYYGFFHYRRYLSFNAGLQKDDGWGNISYDRITDDVINEIGLEPGKMNDIISSYDVITVKGRVFPKVKCDDGMMMDVYRDYGKAFFQHREDMDVTLAVLKELYPEFSDTADRYMRSGTCYECNMFILKKDIFFKYAEWLFSILAEVEKRIDTSHYSVEEYRVFGYLAERLWGLYYTYLKETGGDMKIRCLELPKTLFLDTSVKSEIKPAFADGIPVVFCGSDKSAPYLGVTIQSVIANADRKRNYDLIVLHSDISERNQQLIAWQAAGMTNISIRFAKLPESCGNAGFKGDGREELKSCGWTDHKSSGCADSGARRLTLTDVLPGFHKILYLEDGVICDRDISMLYDTDLCGNAVGAVRDVLTAGQINLKTGIEKHITEESGAFQAYDYFHNGVMILEFDKLRETSRHEISRHEISSQLSCDGSGTVCASPDHDTLNILCRNKVLFLPQKWNVLSYYQESSEGGGSMRTVKMAPRDLYTEYEVARKAPCIVRYDDRQKPWDVVDCDMAQYFWKYARLSAFYEKLLKGADKSLGDMKSAAEITDNAALRKAANSVLPVGSIRREIVKNCFRRLKGK